MTSRAVDAIIAMKPLAQAKSRLAPVLNAQDRADLVRAMVTDVLSALGQTPAIRRIWVITADPVLAGLATGYGAHWLDDARPNDLSTAFSSAVERLSAEKTGAFLLLPGDLPCLTPGALTGLTARLPAHPAVVLAPDRHGRGTNGLLFHKSHPMPRFAFGPDSFVRHGQIASETGLTVLSAVVPQVSHDVDAWADLEAVHALGAGPATAAFLSKRSFGWTARVREEVYL